MGCIWREGKEEKWKSGKVDFAEEMLLSKVQSRPDQTRPFVKCEKSRVRKRVR